MVTVCKRMRPPTSCHTGKRGSFFACSVSIFWGSLSFRLSNTMIHCEPAGVKRNHQGRTASFDDLSKPLERKLPTKNVSPDEIELDSAEIESCVLDRPASVLRIHGLARIAAANQVLPNNRIV